MARSSSALLLAFGTLAAAFHVAVPNARVGSHASRCATPVAGLFEDFGKIVEYNSKFLKTAVAGMTDSRTARASHILFGFAKYENGDSMAAEVKSSIESGEVSFADAAAKFSTCPSAQRGGDLGKFPRGKMQKACLLTLQSLKLAARELISISSKQRNHPQNQA